LGFGFGQVKILPNLPGILGSAILREYGTSSFLPLMTKLAHKPLYLPAEFYLFSIGVARDLANLNDVYVYVYVLYDYTLTTLSVL